MTIITVCMDSAHFSEADSDLPSKLAILFSLKGNRLVPKGLLRPILKGIANLAFYIHTRQYSGEQLLQPLKSQSAVWGGGGGGG